MQDYKYFSDDNPYCDPPDVFELFQFYNQYFFEGILVTCTVKWSTRMTLCAGTCKYEGQKSCTITLSEPLLKFRSNDELKSTLLHEMIHAYLFITKPSEAFINEGHGPAFLEKMNFINQVTGLELSVYHQFHDEVDRCRNHIWRCNGSCQQKPPFFGYVKRAINRPPGKTDYWFQKHQEECGGIFEKISQPEKKQPQKKVQKKKKSNDVKQEKMIKLSNFFQNEQIYAKFQINQKEIAVEFLMVLNSLLNFEVFNQKLESIISCLKETYQQNIEKFNIKKLINIKQSLEKCNNITILKCSKEIGEQMKILSISVRTNGCPPQVSILMQLNKLLK
ncbi:unnamed protein product [Paramecium octaurelia]|uniref:SprT-like domain-containing protein n=1 Tax=Paramecium octaurelia TaxID=43137 RepID=A0A8S1V0F3_PAROT|nr:unnamed protein product [Paramecium octaurelia]